MTESASSTSGQEFDVFSVMDWKDGVGTLPGSDLKFRVNEFGALEVITDESEMESVKKATATTTWMVPTAQDAPTSPPSSRPVFPPAYWTSPPGCPTGTSNSTSLKCNLFSFSFSLFLNLLFSSVTRISADGSAIYTVHNQEIEESSRICFTHRFSNALGFYSLNVSQIWLSLQQLPDFRPLTLT